VGDSGSVCTSASDSLSEIFVHTNEKGCTGYIFELTFGGHLPMDCAVGLSRRGQTKLDVVLSFRQECVVDHQPG